MGLSDNRQRSSSSSTTSNSYGYQPGAQSADINALRSHRFQVDPSIGFRLGEKERQLSDSFQNPTGGYTTPQIKDAIMRSQRRGLMQDASQATREGQFDVNKLDFSRNLAVADMTKPVLTQTGSSSQGQGQVTQSQSPWGTVAGIGASVAPLSL